VLVGACIAVARRLSDWKRAITLAVAVGVMFGTVAVLTKIETHTLTQEGTVALLRSPVTYALIVFGVGATLLQQSAFHAGSLKASVPAMLVLEPVAAVLLGQVVLGEHLLVTTTSAIVLGAAVAAMTAATIALGRDEGAYEDQLEAEAAERVRR
jgi:drug/metabolite transporter (DMT)-like permease